MSIGFSRDCVMRFVATKKKWSFKACLQISALLMTGHHVFAGTAKESTAKIEYNRDVRPILSENCFACHGADSASRKASLRLDRFEDAVLPRKDSKPAIVPGKPEESAVVARIFATNEDDIMPP